MKACPLLWILLLVLLGSGDVHAQFRDQRDGVARRNYHVDMSVDADVQEDFFKRYPDLRDEIDVVTTAARALAQERPKTRDDTEAAELLAKRARSIIARRSQRDWERKAVSLYPELGVEGSEFNTLFLRHVEEMKTKSPQSMDEPSWPVLVAHRCADELKRRQPTTKLARPPSESAPAVPGTPVPEAKPAASTPRWATWISAIVLLVIIALPARWLLHCSRAFAGTEGSAILWQRALQPAAWTYLSVALLAMWRTFAANADQGFLDRFGITLLVSLMAGVVFAVPAYGLALGGMSWWRQRTAAALRETSSGTAASSTAEAGARKA